MDPDETLRLIREARAAYVEARNTGEQLLYVLTCSDDLAKHVNALDEWLTRGGSLPAAWKTGRTIEQERRAYRLRSALREAGVPENLVRAVELGEGPSPCVDEVRVDQVYANRPPTHSARGLDAYDHVGEIRPDGAV